MAEHARELDAALRHVAGRLIANTEVSIDEQGRLHAGRIDAVPDPPSLTDLRRRCEAMLPRVDIGEVVLEVMSWHPEFAAAFTPASGGQARLDEVAVSVAAALTAHALNVGFTPVIAAGVAAMTRHRISRAAKICGHQVLDTVMGYAAIYPEDVITHHRAYIDRRRSLRPSQEYRDLSAEEWDEFLGHFELRKVALEICTRDYGTPCQHEHACVRCPQLRPDPAQLPRLEEIHANLLDRLREANEQGWFGEVAAIEVSIAAADRKLTAMRQLGAKRASVNLGMPDLRSSTGRSNPDS